MAYPFDNDDPFAMDVDSVPLTEDDLIGSLFLPGSSEENIESPSYFLSPGSSLSDQVPEPQPQPLQQDGFSEETRPPALQRVNRTRPSLNRKQRALADVSNDTSLGTTTRVLTDADAALGQSRLDRIDLFVPKTAAATFALPAPTPLPITAPTPLPDSDSIFSVLQDISDDVALEVAAGKNSRKKRKIADVTSPSDSALGELNAYVPSYDSVSESTDNHYVSMTDNYDPVLGVGGAGTIEEPPMGFKTPEISETVLKSLQGRPSRRAGRILSTIVGSSEVERIGQNGGANLWEHCTFFVAPPNVSAAESRLRYTDLKKMPLYERVIPLERATDEVYASKAKQNLVTRVEYNNEIKSRVAALGEGAPPIWRYWYAAAPRAVNVTQSLSIVYEMGNVVSKKPSGISIPELMQSLQTKAKASNLPWDQFLNVWRAKLAPYFMLRMAQPLQRLHFAGFFHGNVSPAAFMTNIEGDPVWLTDYSTARPVSDHIARPGLGAVNYQIPVVGCADTNIIEWYMKQDEFLEFKEATVTKRELVRRAENFIPVGTHDDVWSLALVFCELLGIKFSPSMQYSTYDAFFTLLYSSNASMPPWVSEIIVRMLWINPMDRCTMQFVCEFISSNILGDMDPRLPGLIHGSSVVPLLRAVRATTATQTNFFRGNLAGGAPLLLPPAARSPHVFKKIPTWLYKSVAMGATIYINARTGETTTLAEDAGKWAGHKGASAVLAVVVSEATETPEPNSPYQGRIKAFIYVAPAADVGVGPSTMRRLALNDALLHRELSRRQDNRVLAARALIRSMASLVASTSSAERDAVSDYLLSDYAVLKSDPLASFAAWTRSYDHIVVRAASVFKKQAATATGGDRTENSPRRFNASPGLVAQAVRGK